MASLKFLLITLLALMFICSTSVEARIKHHHPRPRPPHRKPIHHHPPKPIHRPKPHHWRHRF
ncbi:unnamed protein product [Cylicocyclus nassatus]|uniref:Uncharacterized protein n=1 Tax=Cylicocyclus nassatus TaxID=53992 RepID=A0AA36GUT1_CYLNA|nr:unnamed protein product [Cylicocyclus nassatus]